MHFSVFTEDFRADDSVLREVLRYASTNHEQTCAARFDLHFGQLTEVRDRVDRHVRLALFHAINLVLYEAKACRAV